MSVRRSSKREKSGRGERTTTPDTAYLNRNSRSGRAERRQRRRDLEDEKERKEDEDNKNDSDDGLELLNEMMKEDKRRLIGASGGGALIKRKGRTHTDKYHGTPAPIALRTRRVVSMAPRKDSLSPSPFHHDSSGDDNDSDHSTHSKESTPDDPPRIPIETPHSYHTSDDSSPRKKTRLTTAHSPSRFSCLSSKLVSGSNRARKMTDESLTRSEERRRMKKRMSRRVSIESENEEEEEENGGFSLIKHTPLVKNKHDHPSSKKVTPSSSTSTSSSSTDTETPRTAKVREALDSVSFLESEKDFLTSRKQLSFDEDGSSSIKLKKKKPLMSSDDTRTVNLRMLLPTEMEELLAKQHALDVCLASHMSRLHLCVSFSEVRRGVEMITHKSFTLSDLLRIIYQIPECYALSWSAVRSPSELIIQATPSEKKSEMNQKWMTMQTQKQRAKKMRSQLVMIVDAAHSDWMAELDLFHFDPFVTGHWHRRFKLAEVSLDLSLAALPSKKKKKSEGDDQSGGVRQLRNEFDERRKEEEKWAKRFADREAARVKQARNIDDVTPAPFAGRKHRSVMKIPSVSSSNRKRRKESSVEVTPSVSPVPTPDGLSHLGSSFLRNYKAQAKARKVMNYKQSSTSTSTLITGTITGTTSKMKMKKNKDDNHQSKKQEERSKQDWEQVRYLLNLVRRSFISHRKQAMCFDDLINQVCRNHKDSVNVSKSEVERLLYLLSTLQCKVLTVRTGDSGRRIARFDTKQRLSLAASEIFSHSH